MNVSEILTIIGETLLLETDIISKVEYPKNIENPDYFLFELINGETLLLSISNDLLLR